MFGSLTDRTVYVPPYLPPPALPQAGPAAGMGDVGSVAKAFPTPAEIAEVARKHLALPLLRQLYSPLYNFPIKITAREGGDPDGPLVPLPVRLAPERVVPDFPLAAYRSLVG